MSLETELKLRIDSRHLARLAAHPLLKRATPRTTHKLYSVYYDTPDLDLWRAGVTLRLRRSGKKWVQTVKSGGSVTAGLHEREEFETAIATPMPDFEALAGCAAATLFSSLELRAQLKPLIVTDFTRANCMLTPAAGAAIEVSIDHGLVKSGNATETLCELELEVKSGPACHAYQVAAQLLETVPLLVEDRSKAARGFALYLGTPQQPVKAPPSTLTASMASNDAFKSLVQGCVSHFMNNQRGMLSDGDPEYVHQMRVALRRLRSVFSTFAPLFQPAVSAPQMAETRWLAGILGAARDWDVFATETLPPVAGRYANHAGLVLLADAAARLRINANRRARRAVASARGQGLLLALGAWTNAETWLETLNDSQHRELQRPAIEYAREVLSVALKRVRKRGRKFAELAPADLHRLRIAAKKLRYASEFFTPLFDEKPAREYRAVLARLQEALGSYNDAVKMTQLAARASSGLKGVPINEARGIMLGWSAGMQDAGTRYLKRAWKDFRGAEPFWK
ncbi:MAG: CHAD domain-containing protein [Betaproteobacteria bacterium]|nr:CHAD domain-containing protein [Betaproteobacteria bacterium]